MPASKSSWATLISAAIIVLAGCGGGSVSPFGSFASHPASRHPAWMSPQAKDQDLLYVTDNDLIYVYTYPGGKLVGSFYGYGSGNPLGLCVDSAGNVYVTFTYGDTVEYPHGGTVPVQDWNLYSSPLGCSVDPTTGNLAVANYANNLSGGKGFVEIWDRASGQSHRYSYRNFAEPLWCGYDDAGNLFVEGEFRRRGHGHPGLVELPRGGTSLRNISLKSVSFSGAGSLSGVQYDGKYVTIGFFDRIDQLRIRRSIAEVVGTTTLSTPSGYEWNARNYSVVTSGKRRGSHVVATDGDAGIFYYPGGGNPVEFLNQESAISTVVSFAPK